MSKIEEPYSQPNRGRELIDEARFNWGFVPKQTQRLAQVVDALDGYGALIKKFEITSLSPTEQQIVYLATSRENRCGYCVAAHTYLAREAGVSDHQLQALRSGTIIGDARFDALQNLTTAIVRGKGRVMPSTADAFMAAGFRREQVFEILIGVAAKMLVNFFNEIADTPLDEAFAADVWAPSSGETHPSEAGSQ
jgi:AhpD family alkylhydroperoxidase